MKIARLVGTALMLSICGVQAEPAAPAFNGTWHRTWSSTTPKRLHTEGRGMLTIDTQGRSTEIYDVVLTLRTANPPVPLRIVQSCYATSTAVRPGSLKIQWSPRKLVSPDASQIPPMLHLLRRPITRHYTLRGNTLVTLEKEPLVYTRAKPRR